MFAMTFNPLLSFISEMRNFWKAESTPTECKHIVGYRSRLVLSDPGLIQLVQAHRFGPILRFVRSFPINWTEFNEITLK